MGAKVFKLKFNSIYLQQFVNMSNSNDTTNSNNNTTLSQMESIIDTSKLKKDFNKDHLVSYIQHLRTKIEELESNKLIAKRVEILKRSHLISMQYNRRESIEIAGIPETVTDECLEETTLGILEAIGVPKIEPYQVCMS